MNDAMLRIARPGRASRPPSPARPGRARLAALFALVCGGAEAGDRGAAMASLFAERCAPSVIADAPMDVAGLSEATAAAGAAKLWLDAEPGVGLMAPPLKAGQARKCAVVAKGVEAGPALDAMARWLGAGGAGFAEAGATARPAAASGWWTRVYDRPDGADLLRVTLALRPASGDVSMTATRIAGGDAQ